MGLGGGGSADFIFMGAGMFLSVSQERQGVPARIPAPQTSRENKRDKLKGTSGAEFAIFFFLADFP